MASRTLKLLLHRLRQLRTAHGLTQEAFAERSRIAYKYYQQIEAGRKRELRLSTLERLADAYGIEVWELLSPALPKTKMPGPKTSVARSARK
ncbi:MAG: helix-turn-helix domain-containing protein [Limisphaerales bacterium]